mmetsp:Transcript_14640/g.31567  ORF Transcript_14640/g.31567 Transcript_14640/m.31567 type:complete len:402 (-) Transcript_14640:207-1412(-)
MISMKKNMCAAAAALAVSLVPAVDAAADVTAAEVWKPAPEPEEPPFVCDQQPAAMIKAGGYDKVCIERGQAICRDNGHLGEWKFGLDATNDGAVTLWGPDDEVIFSAYEGADALCINIIDHEYWKYHYPTYWNKYEYHHGARRLGNKYPEEPYMIIYGEHQKYAELWCKGVDNTGKNAQFKMTDLSDFTPTINEKFDVVKFKMGSLPNDPINALLTVDVKLVVPYYHDKGLPLKKLKYEPDIQGGIHVNEDYCHWKQYAAATPAPTVSLAPSVSPAPTFCVRETGDHCSVKYQDCCEENRLYCKPDDYASYFAAHQPWSHPPPGKCDHCIEPKHLCQEDYECCSEGTQDYICSEYIDGHKYCVPDCKYKGHCEEDSDCCSGICSDSYGDGHYKLCKVDQSP